MLSRERAALLLLLLSAANLVEARTAAGPVLTVICYHEIAPPGQALDPSYAVSPADFAQQMQWYKAQRFNFVSLDDVIAASKHRRHLPDKPLLLTFDDGLASTYTEVFPLLQRYKAPAVVAVVGRWLEGKPGENVSVDGRMVPREKFLTWPQLRTMAASGLVEVASHTYDLHYGGPANPQGGLQPVATARLWNANRLTYESNQAYRRRVAEDLRHSRDMLSRHGLPAPRAIAWPYGRYNSTLRDSAAVLGMRVGLTLDDGPNLPSTPLLGLRRVLMSDDMKLKDLQQEIVSRNERPEQPPEKAVRVGLDALFDENPDVREQRVEQLVQWLAAHKVETVYLQAFADLDGDGVADATYFPCRHMPVRADWFNDVTWKIRTQADVPNVYAWVPLMAPQPDAGAGMHASSLHKAGVFKRAPRTQQMVLDIYHDLAVSTPLDGVLFDTDVSVAKPLAHDGGAFAGFGHGHPLSFSYQGYLPSGMKQAGGRKPDLLARTAQQLAAVMNEEQPALKAARLLMVPSNPDAPLPKGLFRSLRTAVGNYDFVVVALGNSSPDGDAPADYHSVVSAVHRIPGGISRTVFELEMPYGTIYDGAATTSFPAMRDAVVSQGGEHVALFLKPEMAWQAGGSGEMHPE